MLKHLFGSVPVVGKLIGTVDSFVSSVVKAVHDLVIGVEEGVTK